MKLASLIVPLALLVSAPVRAEDKTPAEKLLELMNFDSTGLAAAKASFKPALEKFKGMGLPPEGIQEISDAADAFFKKGLGDPQLRKDLAKFYEQRFSAEELEELTRFYGSPLGQKSLQVFPEVKAEAGKYAQEYAKKNSADFQADLQRILTKYKKDLVPAAGKEKKEEKKEP
ncbi:DUF2059 domain-containing protein [Luteolibacter ambystomatis]|uniref:DUF2059 domain-containing protein n=1 Tax=Luteolibacter ambystomatis TaxID=2824561 RepID=A0A975G8S2_9BACT|nr:DUF2059 domain-containing protein [Luteolibacter ambystomatis]QUE50795.1 DUF2059 domain-containing protein [Luteolibacter ambystomatis]